MNRKRTLVAICVFFLLVSLSANIVAAGGGAPAIDRYVIGGGGGFSTAGTYTLNATVGQPVAGISGVSPMQICAGFWCFSLPAYSIELPLVWR